MKDKVVIAEATGTAAGGGEQNRGKMIEEAMQNVVIQCYAEGITDDKVILERKLEARRKARSI